ncbi:hypothetical protein POF50_019425 [Streptomyces sp. SL13]|uniref:Uncharacterized protein n=1 Tax=Streptantibioticus silvisoli TaxID=2705255 RepID=A0AA90H6P8_9ACTN|nr:hypothetical protein [Streptantibioticus silvisoli]MDI5971477.1 hypothetical protein [Streptantibioticus silvisoli]
MFGRNTPQDRAYKAKSKTFGGCPPCDDCGGSGWNGDTFDGCTSCCSTGIDPGPRLTARLGKKR